MELMVYEGGEFGMSGTRQHTWPGNEYEFITENNF